MAKRSLAVRTVTPTAVADTAAITADVNLGIIQGGAATQRNLISEIMLGGQAGASTPTFIVAGMNSTAATTIVVGISENAPVDSATAALAAPAAVGTGFTIAPQRSATLGHILQLSFNAFGGIVRWLAPPGGEIGMVGLAVNTGSFSLSAFTGGTPGLMSSHIIYESL